VLVLSGDDVKQATEVLRAAGETVYEIGTIEEGSGEAQAVVV
jgi:phosphoribosylaminoimidazole (AIR) synthetase